MANLPLDHQQEIVEFLDKIYQTVNIEDTIKYLGNYPIFNLLIERNYTGFEEVIWFQENIPRITAEMENIPRKKNLYIKGLFQSIKSKCEVKRLGDIVEIKFGTRITKSNNEVDKNTDNAYPVYGGGDITFYTDNFNRDGETLILSRFGVSPKCVRIITGKIFLNDSGMSLHIKNNECLDKYFKYFIFYNQSNIFNNYASGNAQKNMETSKLLDNFTIPIPPLKIQQEIIHKIEQLNDVSSHYKQYAKTLQIELDNIMETIKNMTNLNKLYKDNTVIIKANRFSIDSDESVDELTDNMMEIIKKKSLATIEKDNSINELTDKLNDIINNKSTKTKNNNKTVIEI